MEEHLAEMNTSGSSADNTVRRSRVSLAERSGVSSELNLEHYWLLLWYRKWIVLGIFLITSAGTAVISYRLPNIFTSETLILVDPQKVPDSYVRPTVTGDIHDRLGTLSQQILSATRLQRVIDSFNLYPEERQKLAREEVIGRMRKDIGISVVSDFGASQALQAFKISYSGKDPRVVAEVTNELASLFIEENLKAREQQATGTSDFLENQLEETKKELEEQEAKLRDFKLKHIGEMPEQQAATLGIYGQLQSQLRSEEEALTRAEQQRSYLQSLMAQSVAPVVDIDPPSLPSNDLQAKLTALLSRYSEKHPDVQRLKSEIAKQKTRVTADPAGEPNETHSPSSMPVETINPVLKSQLSAVDTEAQKHKAEQERLTQLVSSYRAKLEAVPVREQEVTDLERDYEISKAHYGQLLDKKLSADTATQLEVRQKGEKFTILDPAQVAEKPSSPNRMLIDVAGALVGLGLGLTSAFIMEFLGMSITSVAQLSSAADVPVLGVVPIIRTRFDKQHRKRWILAGGASGLTAILVGSAFLLYHYRHF
jgi:succinoglycan biosynthesis transport protein ExoP